VSVIIQPPDVKFNENAFTGSRALPCITTERYGKNRRNFATPHREDAKKRVAKGGYMKALAVVYSIANVRREKYILRI
jgi:hypothetical protein